MSAETSQEEFILAIDIDDTAVPIRDREMTAAERAQSHADLLELTAAVTSEDSIKDFGLATGRTMDSCMSYAYGADGI